MEKENKIAVSIHLGKKKYDIAITAEEEPTVRKAEKLYNEVYEIYMRKFKNAGTEDLFAMTGFGLANKIISLENPDS